MSSYLEVCGTIARQTEEALDHVAMLRARAKGRFAGPDRNLQQELSRHYREEVEARLQQVGRAIIELGEQRPARFAVALGRLYLNLGEVPERMADLLYVPGSRNVLPVVLAQLDHIHRSLGYFRKAITARDEPGKVDLNLLLHEAALTAVPCRSDFLPLGDKRIGGPQVREKPDRELPALSGEPEALYLAFYQIVANAAQAAGLGEGPGQVDIHTRYFERFRQLQVAVADNGPGVDRAGVLTSALEAEVISPQQAEGLARDRAEHDDPVFQLMFLPRVGAFQGSRNMGLGLTLAREELSRHGGKIEIHSKPGRGVTVQVLFTLR